MTIVVYDDVIVPNSVILAGVAGTQRRSNDRSENPGGFVSVNAVRDITMRTFQLGIAPMDVAAWADLEGIYEVTDAGTFGMLLEDPKDSSVTIATGALIGYMAGVQNGTVGRGNGTPNYTFQKVYTAKGSTRMRARDVTRPRSPSLFRGGSPVTIGVSAGNASLSSGPVKVTFIADDTRSVSSVAVGATTTVTLPTALPGLAIGGRLWLQGLTGADASLLNNLSHQITNIASNVYTLAVNTAGKTITAGAGAAHKYPQPTETLTWSGSFYVPVHFRDDNLEWDLVVAGASRDGRRVSGPSVFLDEVREA